MKSRGKLENISNWLIDNDKTAYQNVWHIPKAVLTVKYLSLYTSIKSHLNKRSNSPP